MNIEQIKKEIGEIVANGEHYAYGVRVDDVDYSDGSFCRNSHILFQDYVEGCEEIETQNGFYWDGGEASGTFAMDTEDLEKCIDWYEGKYIHLIAGGSTYDSGYADEDYIIPEAICIRTWSRGEEKMKKYIAVNYNENAGQNPKAFDSLEDANRWTEALWGNLTESEKKHSHYYVAEVTEDMIEDGDWEAFDDYNTGINFFDSDEIGSVSVSYEGGESREFPSEAIDFMLARFTDDDDEDVELYAEEENPTWNDEDGYFDDETYTYETLKDEILEQASEVGLHPSRLKFWYDR